MPRLGPASDFDVLTQHNDPQRTGASLHETILTPDSVQHDFQRLFDWEVDGQIYAQPLYLSSVPYRGRTINMVIVATMNNSVYAFEAPPAGSDAQPSSEPLWHVAKDKLGEPLRYDYFSMDWAILGFNIKPLIGITSTPVIDRRRGLVYVTAKSGGGFLGLFERSVNRLFAIDVLSGAIKDQVDIEATYTGVDGKKWTLDAEHHLQRAGLLEANDRIYLAFGSHQDSRPYHGWVLAYDADDLHRSWTFCATCGYKSSDMGGIWQAGGGPAADAAGSVYVMTGNGTYDADAGDFATSFIKLDKDLRVAGAWTPASQSCLTRTDSDLGSAGPVFLGKTATLIGGGKEGVLYALQPEALRGTHLGSGVFGGRKYPCYVTCDPAPLTNEPGIWSTQAAPAWEYSGLMDFLRHFDAAVLSQGYHHIHGAPVAWTVHDQQGDRTLVYISAERDLLRAYTFDQGFGRDAAPPGEAPVDTFHSDCRNSSHGMPGGFLAISADGNKPETGIVWVSMPRRDKDALHSVVPGVLRAYRAVPEHGSAMREIWNSDNEANVTTTCKDDPPSGLSDVGLFAKYASPTVAEGKVYLATFSHRLDVYGLRGPVAAAARTAASPASLATGALPAVVESGKPIAISVVAKNPGPATWHAADGVRLVARKMPAVLAAPIEGASATTVLRDVAPGQTYTFNFHILAPKEEGAYYFGWQLSRAGAATAQPSGGWFGLPTPEWAFEALRSDCADLRQRTAALAAHVPPGKLLPLALQSEVEAVRKSAETRGCSLLEPLAHAAGMAP
jgi:hypothetical protein